MRAFGTDDVKVAVSGKLERLKRRFFSVKDISSYFGKISKKIFDKKNVSLHTPIGMRDRLLSLFVGAAIVGSVLSSSHAEITISPQAREKLLKLNLERLKRFCGDLNGRLKEKKIGADFGYDNESMKADAKHICDVVCTENSSFPRERQWNHPKPWLELHKSLIELVNGAIKDGKHQEISWFLSKNGVGVFLKFIVCGVTPDSDDGFKNEWKRIVEGNGMFFTGIPTFSFSIEEVPLSYSNPFRIQAYFNELFCKYQSVVTEWLEVESNETLTDQQVASLFAEKFFSDGYIEQVQSILRAECDYDSLIIAKSHLQPCSL